MEGSIHHDRSERMSNTLREEGMSKEGIELILSVFLGDLECPAPQEK
jgi:hypothetical protein